MWRLTTRLNTRILPLSVTSAAFAHDAQAIETPILMQVFDRERGDFRAAESHLQAHGKDGTVAQPLNRVLRRRVE